MTKDIPLDEINIYSSLLKEKLKKELEEENDGETPFLTVYTKDILVGEEAIREISIKPVEVHQTGNPSVNELWF